MDWELSPNACYPGHELNGGEAILSFHQKWMTSGAPDGKLLVRLVENPVSTFLCMHRKSIEHLLVYAQTQSGSSLKMNI